MVEVWLLQQELEEEKNRNVVSFWWIQTVDMKENLSLWNQMARITIDSLKKKINNFGDEIMSLHSFYDAESKVYDVGFEDFKLLATQILSEAWAHLIWVPVTIELYSLYMQLKQIGNKDKEIKIPTYSNLLLFYH